MAESEAKEKRMGMDNPGEEKKEKPKKATKTEIIKSRGGASEKVNSTLRGPIKKIQHGVTDAKTGKTGAYVWYKEPGPGAKEKDRDMVYDENMKSVYDSPEGRAYAAKQRKTMK